MNLKEALIRDEGLCLTIYNDTQGISTIGVGRNLQDKGITEDEAMVLLENDILDCEATLTKHLEWTGELDPPRREVLLNMVFNMGIAGLLKFQRMLAALKERKYVLAAKEMLNSVWARQVGNRARRLATQMETGVRQ